MKAYRAPLLLLAALLAAAAVNCAAMDASVNRWQSQLDAAQSAASADNWPAARAALAGGYASWSARQTYLHIVMDHGAVDGAEAMYRRCAAFAAAEESAEFRAELAGLRHQLSLLSEMERFSVKNVL